MVLWSTVFLAIALWDPEPPVIETHEVTANYNTPIKLESLASITDNKDEAPTMAITNCDPKAGTISKDGRQSLSAKWENSQFAWREETLLQMQSAPTSKSPSPMEPRL